MNMIRLDNLHFLAVKKKKKKIVHSNSATIIVQKMIKFLSRS